MPRDAREFVVGDRLPGTKWVVRGKLGEGGMGLVLDVVKEPGIRGAMKVMLPAFAKQPEFVTRFLDEVKLLAQLRHPNIVQVFDFDQLDDGTPYIVMERLHGVTLRAGLRNLREKGTPISAKLIYEVTRQLCEGLFRAHSNTPVIVHRDVKPENIFFHQPEFADTIVKVIDFGIAAVADGTRDRRVFGTPRHMAPEQIRGDLASPATDVYAAALVLYELLTGRFPWDVDLQDELALVDAHLHRPPAAPSQYTRWVPRRVDLWILRALSKDPRARPQDAYQFIAKLYELQFANDGTSDSVVDINTTAPTLARLAEAVEDAMGTRPRRHDFADTCRSMTLPPIEGAPLELAPADLSVGLTDPMGPPNFSLHAVDPAALAITELPSGVDRFAPTRTSFPATRPAPESDTPVLSLPLFDQPSELEEAAAESFPVGESSPGTAETPMASTSSPPSLPGTRIVPSRLRRGGLVGAAIGTAAIATLLVGVHSLRRTHPARTVEPAAIAPAPADPTPASPSFASPLVVSDLEARPQSSSASSVPVQKPAARRVFHAPAKPPADTHEPDDGRDLLYVHP